MADDYSIENVGADDYDISRVGKGGHHGGGRRRGGRNSYGGWGYAPDPLFYQIVQDDDGHYKKVADDDTEDDKGSAVAGGFAKESPYWSAVGGSIDVVSLGVGKRYWSPNKKGFFVHQSDGNNVIYTSAGKAIWSTRTLGIPPKGQRLVLQDDGNLVLLQGTTVLWNSRTAGWAPARATGVLANVAHIGSDIVHTANNAAKFAGKAIGSVEKLATKIPLVGPLVHATLALSPAHLLGGMAASALRGERLDHVFLDAGKKQLAGIKEIAPYASKIVSFVPGVGTGVAAAIAAGTALAEGKTITQALIDATKSALPGGGSYIDAAMAIAAGKNVADTAVKAAIAQLPPAAQSAAKVAMSAAKGQNVKGAVLQAIRSNLPAAGQKALDVGTALGTARNVQSAIVGAVAKGVGAPALLKQGASVLASSPKFAKAAQALSPPARAGYTKAMGLLSNAAVNPHAIVAMRAAAKPDEQAGIDHALKTYVNHFTPEWPTLVSNGSALRGNWKPCKANDKNGTRGRLVQNGKVTQGYFSRV